MHGRFSIIPPKSTPTCMYGTLSSSQVNFRLIEYTEYTGLPAAYTHWSIAYGMKSFILVAPIIDPCTLVVKRKGVAVIGLGTKLCLR